MARPEAAHRVKSYSSETGYVYQYYFFEVQKSRRGAVEGSEYTYMVSADRKTTFPVKIFVRQDALRDWTQQTGRALTGTEEYAVAKMRLFQAFDGVEALATPLAPGSAHPDFFVDTTNLPALLETLDL